MLGQAEIEFKYSAWSSGYCQAATEEIGSFSEPAAWRIGFIGHEIYKFTNSRLPATGSVQGIQDYMPLDCRRFAPRMPKNGAKSAPNVPRKTPFSTDQGRADARP